MRPLSVEAELMSLRVAPSIWQLGIEYAFLKTFEGSRVMEVPDKILHPAIRTERKRIRANVDLPAYLQEHNWLYAQSCHKAALEDAVRRHSTAGNPQPLGLQDAASGLLTEFSDGAIFTTVSDTKWLTTLDPRASLSPRKLRTRMLYAGACALSGY